MRRVEVNRKVQVADDPATMNEENMHAPTVFRLVARLTLNATVFRSNYYDKS